MTKPTLTPRAQQILSRSRGKAPRPMPVPGLAEGPRVKTEDAAKLDASTGNRPAKPPHRHRFVGGGCEVCGMLEVEST